MPRFHLAVFPRDGIGPEVIAAGLDVLHAVAAQIDGVEFTTDTHSVGAIEFLRNGDPLPPATIEKCRACDVILLGAMKPKFTFERDGEGLHGVNPLIAAQSHSNAPIQQQPVG